MIHVIDSIEPYHLLASLQLETDVTSIVVLWYRSIKILLLSQLASCFIQRIDSF
jgi:hypothetical protein